MSAEKTYKILWVDDDENLLKAAKRLLRPHFPDAILTSSVEEAEKLLDQEVAVVISDQRMPAMTGVSFLKRVKEKSSSTARILLTGFLEAEIIEEAVNEAGVFRFMTKPWNEEELVNDIRKGIEHYKKSTSQAHLMKEVSQQNRKLEELTSGLEKLVEERTRHIEESKNQVEKNLSEMRKLVLFIKDLAGLKVLDELLPLIKKEIKKFHHIRNPVLCFSSPEGKYRALYFRGRDVIETEIRNTWPASLRLRINQLEDSRYLADIFSRPFAKVIAIPLGARGKEQDNPATFFFEHDVTEGELDLFLAFISQRLQPLSLAVERILLEYQANFVSRQWESTFDGVESPIAIIDREFDLIRANRFFTENISSKEDFIELSETEVKAISGPVQKALMAGQSQSEKVHLRGRIYNVDSYPIKIEAKENPIHVINHYTDITDSRALYGRAVQNEKLAAIGVLAGHITHELNNPLTGIRSLSQVLRAELKDEPDLPSTFLSDLEEIEKATERSQEIIKNLLDFSQNETSDQEVVISLNRIVDRTLPLLKTAMRNHNNHVVLTEEEALVKVKPQLIQQVFFNLVTNACHAMEETGLLEIFTEIRKNDSGEWVDLKVRDSGAGIPEDVLMHIFEPFYTTKGEGKGTGLGLSMSRSIIEKSGGVISVESRVSEGTCFTVSLPRYL